VIAKFLIEEVDLSFGFGFRGSLLARLAVAALHLSKEGAATDEIASRAIELRRTEYRSSMLPMESAAIIRGLLRIHNVTDAMNILHDELSFPMDGTPFDSPENQDRIRHRAYSLASVVSRHFYEMEPMPALKACNMLKEMGPLVRESGLDAEDLNMPWARLIQGAAQCESARRDGSITIESSSDIQVPCNLVYSVLNAMTSFPSRNDDETYEALSNALVRRTTFITGAVDLSGCPAQDRGEVVFIGRSNVGKSSLVNMVREIQMHRNTPLLLYIDSFFLRYTMFPYNCKVTNRKSLAYTSKRPGKTQQFNFFAVNDKPGKEKEIKYGDFVPGEKDADSFYILDVPGFGFAKVPEQLRNAWSDFLSQYIKNRKTLRVVFHLIDGRHGPIDEDENIMKQISETKPHYVHYVIVLTKADKNVKGANVENGGKVSKTILEKVRKCAQDNNVGSAPILLTSAETKLGRDDMWRYMRLAAEV